MSLSPFSTANDQHQVLAQKAISSLTLTEMYADRIHKYNPKLNAIVIDNTEEALKEAIAFDKAPGGGSIAGVPVTVKEAFNMKGLKSTVNFKAFADYVAPSDSVVVDRIYKAQGIILGKTNIPVLLGDHQSFGPLYPTANNPWDTNKTPGGSTGGGAAAVAAGLTTFEIGSDIGGSIRVPAHFCGVFGLKPSENMYVELGHLPAKPSSPFGWIQMASYGPLARSMADIELAYNIVNAPDWRHRANLPVVSNAPLHSKISDYKIGWFDTIGGFDAGNETRAIISKFVDQLSGTGVNTSQFEFGKDWFEKVVQVWGVFFGLVNSQGLKWMVRQVLKRRFSKMDAGATLSISRYIKEGMNQKFDSYTRTLRVRQKAAAELYDYFQEYDFIVSPVMRGPAFDHNHKHQPIELDGKKIPYVDHNLPFAIPWNSLGNPSLVIPTGITESGLPVGLQIVGPVHSEKALIHFGKMIEDLGYTFSAPQGYE
ncbi:MAG: hypothetical protein KJP00_10030 [Bacteroidia bacterium]|nr:hypothetical protein [Bacteroidia bacterium]